MNDTPQSKEEVVFCIATSELPEQVRAWLEQHYCHLTPHADGKGFNVFFPAGTVKSEILPRTQQERYEITLPDGARCREQRLRGMIEGKSALFPVKYKEPYEQ
jgi:hypothetical protein